MNSVVLLSWGSEIWDLGLGITCMAHCILVLSEIGKVNFESFQLYFFSTIELELNLISCWWWISMAYFVCTSFSCQDKRSTWQKNYHEAISVVFKDSNLCRTWQRETFLPKCLTYCNSTLHDITAPSISSQNSLRRTQNRPEPDTWLGNDGCCCSLMLSISFRSYW